MYFILDHEQRKELKKLDRTEKLDLDVWIEEPNKNRQSIKIYIANIDK
jgi:hypothetical protein